MDKILDLIRQELKNETDLLKLCEKYCKLNIEINKMYEEITRTIVNRNSDDGR